jgi:hypothetical protein
MLPDNQVAFAEMLAAALNEGPLQDTVELDAKDPGPFTIDVPGMLDALASAGLKLVPDEGGDASIAYTTLLGIERDIDDGDTPIGG